MLVDSFIYLLGNLFLTPILVSYMNGATTSHEGGSLDRRTRQSSDVKTFNRVHVIDSFRSTERLNSLVGIERLGRRNGKLTSKIRCGNK